MGEKTLLHPASFIPAILKPIVSVCQRCFILTQAAFAEADSFLKLVVAILDSIPLSIDSGSYFSPSHLYLYLTWRKATLYY